MHQLAGPNFENFNPGGIIFGLAFLGALIIGPFSYALWAGGRDGRAEAQTRWGRALSHVSFYAGWAGMVVAALVFVAGALVGLTSRSPYERKLADARAECKAMADGVPTLKADGERKAYVEECVSIIVD